MLIAFDIFFAQVAKWCCISLPTQLRDITKKRKMPARECKGAKAQLEAVFDDRFEVNSDQPT